MVNNTPVKKATKPAKKTAVKTKKTAVKQVATEIDSIEPETIAPKHPVTPKLIFDTWIDGWKKTFVLKGRASRFELWMFLLINSIITSILHIGCYYIASPSYLRSANAGGYSINAIETHIILTRTIFYAIMIISCIPTLSVLVRRMHDIGTLAWKKYLEPASMSIVSMWIMFLAAIYIEEMEYGNNFAGIMTLIAIVVYVCFIISLYASGYHLLRFLISTLFYRGKNETNSFGKAPIYNTPYHEDIALSTSCIYFLFIITMSIIQTFLFLI